MGNNNITTMTPPLRNNSAKRVVLSSNMEAGGDEAASGGFKERSKKLKAVGLLLLGKVVNFRVQWVRYAIKMWRLKIKV